MAARRASEPPDDPGLLTIGDLAAHVGVSERTLALERDGWTLLMALAPEHVAEWAAGKSAALSDPDFQRLYLAWEDAYDWDPDDPRLAVLAADAAAFLADRPPPPPLDAAIGLSTAYSLLDAQLAAGSPAWRRLSELTRSGVKPAGPAD